LGASRFSCRPIGRSTNWPIDELVHRLLEEVFGEVSERLNVIEPRRNLWVLSKILLAYANRQNYWGSAFYALIGGTRCSSSHIACTNESKLPS
jgi:hypothetical protein